MGGSGGSGGFFGGANPQDVRRSPEHAIKAHDHLRTEMPALRFMGMPPNSDSSGDIELRSLLAGQAVGQIHDIKPANEIVRDLVDGVREIFQRRASE